MNEQINPLETENYVGSTLYKLYKISAIEALKKANIIEHIKIKRGYRWLTKGKVSRLIAPNKFRAYLKDNWHRSI